MTLYALIYRYIDDPAVVAAHRPEHRAYLRTLADTGALIVAGPLGPPGPAGGLLVFDADSAADVDAFADNDPFSSHGVIAERRVAEWTLSIGADRLPTRTSVPDPAGASLERGRT